jgi:hypothetical protein
MSDLHDSQMTEKIEDEKNVGGLPSSVDGLEAIVVAVPQA